MKRLILILFIFSSSFSFSQKINENILELIAANLKIKKDSININLVTSMPVPFMENTEIFVVPIIIENGDGYQILNNSIFYIENNETIKYSLRENFKLYTDAIRLNYFEIDFENFNIQDNSRAFGIKIIYSGSSRVNPSEFVTINLYQIINNQITNILNEFEIYRGSGGNNGRNTGEYTSTESILLVEKTITDNYRDIKVKERKTLYEFSENDEKEAKSKYKIKGILKFDKKTNKYVLQQRL